MVISHAYRYLYVALPQTGSTAVSRELCANYKGKKILRNHALYSDFLKTATGDEKTFFVFSGIRNPLDETVSRYFKTSRTSPRWNRTRTQRKAIQFVKETNPDFANYLKYRCKFPYNNWSSLAHHEFDYIMRFENLQEDFSLVLRMQDIEQIRPLPFINKTTGREKDFASYFTPDIIDHAKRIFGPFMHTWGYEFPAGWGEIEVSRLAWAEYHIVNLVRNFYWKELMYHPRLGRLARSLR